MPRELVTIQIGQCGNQIGCKFWELALQEHAQKMKKDGEGSVFNESLSTFFRNVDSRYDDLPDIPYDPKKPSKIYSLKARAILIDMEEGVLNSLLNKNELSELFDSRQALSDVSGSGNNWAHGHEIYGPQYHEQIAERVRQSAELCDSLQCFFLLHSMGGGTGSGLGTYILQMLSDEYPDVYRFVTAVFPSEDDDVITSPYNSMLAMNELIQYADCVLPIENQSLYDLTNRVNQICSKLNPKSFTSQYNHSANITSTTTSSTNSNSVSSKKAKERPFDQMNSIAAHLLTSLTSSMRFEGNLNVDLNEITMNLVPYPKLHFLTSSLSPLVLPRDVHLPVRRLDQMFSDAFSKDYQLLKCDPKHNRYLACGLMVRGNVQISDINRNITKLKKELDMIYWNQEGFKIGLCNVPPISQPYSLLCLANNCCISDTFSLLRQRFMRFYSKNLYLHHYTKYMEKDSFDECDDNLLSLINHYEELKSSLPPSHIPRFIPTV